MVKRITTSRLISNPPRENSRGFTLVELLVVLAIAAILAVLAAPALQSLQNAGGFTKSVYGMADALNLARSYAMANNTYVYVGLTEVDRTQNPGVSPQATGVGRVALSIVATTDGLSDTSTWNNTTSSEAASGAGLVQVRQVQTFDFVHIANTGPFLGGVGATTGNMALPKNMTNNGITTTTLPIPAAAVPALLFSLPLGTASSSNSSNGKYNFTNTNTQIICFNPQGEALLPVSTTPISLQPNQWLEIDVQRMVGTVTPTTPSNMNKGELAALLIDGMTGALTVHRP